MSSRAEDALGKDGTDHLIRIEGQVQGVGFRPFVVRVAALQQVNGWVLNDAKGVTIRLRAGHEATRMFAGRLQECLPPAAHIERLSIAPVQPSSLSLPAVTREGMTILPSPANEESASASVTPDLALCADCRRELLDPVDRRHNYPFINCTNCGPRYSIVRALPYDRERTSMAGFTMCDHCRKEYEDVLDRRYHAQPNACESCGPGVFLSNNRGGCTGQGPAAIQEAAKALLAGKIVAVKGLGGFHLFVDASSPTAVSELRKRKHRDEKPLAVMFPSIESLREHAVMDATDLEQLQSPAAPIVILRRKEDSGLAEEIAPGNPWIGALLPYTPLHVLLMECLRQPMVATSANLSEEPLCTDNEEALERLGSIADLFLLHDRPIARPVDDSVIRTAASGTILLRRARGFAPAPLMLPADCVVKNQILSVGGHLKNTVAVTLPGKIVLSPHIGDLSNSLAVGTFRRTIELLTTLYGGEPDAVACDLHPDYASTRYAADSGLPVTPVQHHLAHLLSCVLEHGGGPDKVLGVIWDGTGYGDDGTIWGGEFILLDRREGRANRLAHLRTFKLPGGEEAIRSTGRCALGLVHQGGLTLPETARHLLKDQLGGTRNLGLMRQAMDQDLNAPLTSSAGRLFDGVASLLDLARDNAFEGKAGMAVESAASSANGTGLRLPWQLAGGGTAQDPFRVDWSPALQQLIDLHGKGRHPHELAFAFHRCLADIIVTVADKLGIEAVALSGGCFQNALLQELTADALSLNHHKVLLHRKLPPNDNAIAAGQALGLLWGITRTRPAT